MYCMYTQCPDKGERGDGREGGERDESQQREGCDDDDDGGGGDDDGGERLRLFYLSMRRRCSWSPISSYFRENTRCPRAPSTE